jgi:Tol biopolymer transport system component
MIPEGKHRVVLTAPIALGLLLFGFIGIGGQESRRTAEPHLANIRQLTTGGENAEAYFSSDGKRLVFQGRPTTHGCDQIYIMGADGSGKRLVSTGKGRCTCAYFLKDGEHVLFSSTHAEMPQCPPPPDYSKGYVWPVYDTYKIYLARTDGTLLKCLTPWRAYSAEATVSPDGQRIVFTSDKDGDLDLYTMTVDGKDLRRITNLPGYDGGAFFSPDSKMLCFRGEHPTDPKVIEEDRDLLRQHLVRPQNLELYVANADGSGLRQVTHNGAANFCPFFTPDGRRLIFSSNMGDPGRMKFELYLINLDGSGLEQVTHSQSFEAFPMFSPDGTKLVWGSNRNQKAPHETDLFIADWVEHPAPAVSPAAGPSVAISAAELKRHVFFLASDEMKGRLTGSPEGTKTAGYIAAEFKKLGLKPVPGQEGYFQPFEFISGVKLGASNTLTIASSESSREYKVGQDYTPTGFSEDASLKGLPVVFAGYGITAPDQKWDDYAGLDVKGKAVFVFRHGPEGDDPKSPYALYYPIRYKAMAAREHGAAALFVVGASPDDDDLLPLKSSAIAGSSGIVVATAKRSLLEPWLKGAGQSYPDPNNPHGAVRFELPGVQLSVSTSLTRETGRADNVLGWLPATAQTSETVVIGAHWDHLGLGIEGSLDAKPGRVHHGADDNASGVAGVLELAHAFSAQPARGRNTLFMSFGGEEIGSLGSSHFVKNPLLPLKDVVTMINLDMIGRLREDKLVVTGSGTSSAFKALLERENSEGLTLTLNEDGYGASDQGVFYAKDVPVLFFFTGAHEQYHRPEDTADLVNYDGEAEVLRFVGAVLGGLLAAPERPPFTKVKGAKGEMAGRGFRVYLGTIPDYTEQVKGVKLMGVREGSPAEKAGLKAGDVIVRFGEKGIENIYDYTYALQDHKPGETVDVTVLRDGKPLTLPVRLEKRPSE